MTPDEVMDWLRRNDGRIEDIFGLWVQGKRDDRWVAEKLITEGHLAALPSPETTPAGVLDEAWAAAEKALPANWDLWLAATGPGFMAQANGPRDESVQAWSQADPELPNYDPNATPAAALHALAAALGRSGSGGGRG